MSNSGMLHHNIFGCSLRKEGFQYFLSEVSAIYSEENRVDFVVNNCRSHLNVSTILENHRIVYLPPYSPFFNIIEEALSFIKNQVKKRKTYKKICPQ